MNVSIFHKIETNDGGFEGATYTGMFNRKMILNFDNGAGSKNPNAFSVSFEKHARVHWFEAAGLYAQGFDIVNVAQKVTFFGQNGKIWVQAFTDVFPSARLNVNTTPLFHYRQPSFKETHTLFSRPATNLYRRY